MQIEAAPKDKSAAEGAAAAAREQQARAQQENQRRKDKAAERKHKANQKRKAHEAERKAQEAAAKAEVMSPIRPDCINVSPYSPSQSMLLSSKQVMTVCHGAAFSLTHLVSCAQKQQQAFASICSHGSATRLYLQMTTVPACSPHHLNMYPNQLSAYKRPQHRHAHHII